MKRSPLLIPIAAILGASVLAACDPTPDEVISPEPMAQLLADIELGESEIDINSGKYTSDSLKKQLLQSIYAAHGVTSAEVDTSIAWYGHNIEQYTKVYARVGEILDKRIKESRDVAVDVTATSADIVADDGDSVDIWGGERRYRFIAGKSPSTIIGFDLSRDRNAELGDAYILRYKVVGGSGTVHTSLGSDYVNATTDYAWSRSVSPGWHELVLATDSATSLSHIFGSLGVEPRGASPLYIDSLSLIRLRNKPGRMLNPSPKKRLHR